MCGDLDHNTHQIDNKILSYSIFILHNKVNPPLEGLANLYMLGMDVFVLECIEESLGMNGFRFIASM